MTLIPWSDATKRRIGLAVIAVAAVGAVADVAILVSLGEVGVGFAFAIIAIAFTVATTLSIRAVPHNGAVWAMIWAYSFGAATDLGRTIGFARTGFTTEEIELSQVAVAPSEIDALASIGFAVALSAWIVAAFVLITHLLILFPGGSAGSVRWRMVAWVSALSMAVFSISVALGVAPWVDTPYNEIYAEDGSGPAGIFELLWLVLMLIAAGSLVDLVRRYRRSVGEERLQYRWVTWALALMVLIIVGAGSFIDSSLPFVVALALIPLSFTVAILRYRLYDIDIVINRTIVFVLLAVFITVVYAVGVVALGSLVGGSSVWLAMAATAVVAVAFEPVRARAQRLANRMVYGKRATPYEVLAELSQRLPEAEDESGLLDRMAAQLASGTGAYRAKVWLVEGGLLQRAASHPSPHDAGEADVAEWRDLPGHVTAIEHDGDRLGALTVELPAGSVLHPAELRLVEDLAGSAGLVIRTLRLDAELEETARELELSRRRMVEAQDLERRKLERDLNDGAQQNVVGLKVKLSLAARLAAEEESIRTAELLEQMSNDAQTAVDAIGDLARGIYSPVLESDGLAAAIHALAAQSPLEVRVTIDVATRRPLEVEEAVYFCISEALTNASKHAAAPIVIVVTESDGGLSFSVADAGPGFDLRGVVLGAGLDNIADRLDALGGSLTITSEPGSGTTVAGSLPALVAAE